MPDLNGIISLKIDCGLISEDSLLKCSSDKLQNWFSSLYTIGEMN